MHGSYVGILLILILQAAANSPPPPVNDGVSAVSKNVSDFNELVPDFICTEKIECASGHSGHGPPSGVHSDSEGVFSGKIGWCYLTRLLSRCRRTLRLFLMVDASSLTMVQT